MTTDYEKTLTALAEARHDYTEIKDLRGIVEAKKPDRCPPQQAHNYYSWGLRFTSDHQFIESWGTPPVLIQ